VPVRGTHSLEMGEAGTGQDSKRKWAGGTYLLERAEVGAGQNMARKQASK
jgi:hypothetical protein